MLAPYRSDGREGLVTFPTWYAPAMAPGWALAGGAVVEGEFPAYQGVNMMISPRRTVLDALPRDGSDRRSRHRAWLARRRIALACCPQGLGGAGDLPGALTRYEKQRIARPSPPSTGRWT